MNYTCVTTLKKIQGYLAGAAIVAFDFETSPTEEYRSEDRAALDAHKSVITGVSFSVSEGSAIYVPLRHLRRPNADPEQIIPFLRDALYPEVGGAHGLSADGCI